MIDFKTLPAVMALFETRGRSYRKKAVTLGRRPRADEIGQSLVSYVADGDAPGGVRVETTNTITPGVVVARNPAPIAAGVFNEWLVPADTWLKNYGALPTGEDFEAHKKQALVTAIDIDHQVLAWLGSTDGRSARIKVDWGEGAMNVYLGGLLASQGYGIGPQEASETYEAA